jgi:hypothetical protein
MFTHFFALYSPFYSLFLAISPFPLVPTPPTTPGRTYSTFQFSDFVEEKGKDKKKNMTFLLV